MTRLTVILTLLLISYSKVYSQKIYAIPQHWYKGASDTSLELYINKKEIRDSKVTLLSDIVRINKRHSNNDKNSLKLDLIIPTSYEANIIPFEFQIKKKKQVFNYLLVDKPTVTFEKVETDSFVIFMNTSVLKNETHKNNLLLKLSKTESHYYTDINTLEEIQKDTDSIIILEADSNESIENLVSLDKILNSKKVFVFYFELKSKKEKQDQFYYNLLIQQTLFWFLNQKIAAVAIKKSTTNFSEKVKYFEAIQ